MNKDERKIFVDVMTEPLVIDFDVNAWDRYVRLVVVQGEDHEFSATSDVFNVDFIGTGRISWDATRILGFGSNGEVHVRWEVWKTEIKDLDNGYKVTIRGSGPLLDLECENVRVTTVDAELVSAVAPKWFEAGQPLARPSLEGIAAILRKRRK